MTNIQIITQTQPKTYIDEILNNAQNSQIFMFEKGNYFIQNPIKIMNKTNITLRGITGNSNEVTITQEGTTINPENNETIHYDGINIVDSNYVTIDGLTVSVNKEEGTPIALSVSGSSHVRVSNCRFYGSNNNFAIYFSGPTGVEAAQETIDAYNAGQIDSHNIFEKNMIVSYSTIDGVVFALQKDGIIQNNIVYGCRIAIYMVRDVLCHNNYSYNSKTTGIVCSVPSHNLEICNNVINNATSTGIKISEQMEHGDTPVDSFMINIYNNEVRRCLNGVDVVDCHHCNIHDNTLIDVQDNGVTTIRVDHCEIKNNMLVNCPKGINISVETFNTEIMNNNIYNLNPADTAKVGIKLERNTGDNTISNNTINIHDEYSLVDFENIYVIDYDSKPDADYNPDERVNVIENNIIKNTFDYYNHIVVNQAL